jgi:hypothetical protein
LLEELKNHAHAHRPTRTGVLLLACSKRKKNRVIPDLFIEEVIAKVVLTEIRALPSPSVIH